MTATWLADVAAADPLIVIAVLVRMAAAVGVGVLPITSGVGARIQMALVLALTIVAVPAAAASADAAVCSRPALLVVAGEAVVGLVLGLATAAVLAAAAWAGTLLGSVTGLSWADDFTPDGEGTTAGVSRLAWWLGLSGFLAAGGHLEVIAGLVDSLRMVPIGAAFTAGGRVAPGLEHVGFVMPSLAMSLALSLAVPALTAVLACHLAAVICVRTVGFDPGQGLLQAAASLVLLAAICLGAEAWMGGFATAVEVPLERIFHDVRR
ncbi:MAG: flagellar biosynthetic protein FliR [Pirellulales bacterium]